MSAPVDTARHDLEDALTAIEGLGRVLIALHDPDTGATCYCGSRLLEHYEAAHDAFCRVFCVGAHASQ